MVIHGGVGGADGGMEMMQTEHSGKKFSKK